MNCGLLWVLRPLVVDNVMTKKSNFAHYLDERLKNLQISEHENGKTVHVRDLDGKQSTHTIQHFERHGYDIRINYHDLNGLPFTFTRNRTSSLHASNTFTDNFYRLRRAPFKCVDGSPKYIQPKHSRMVPYLNGLLQFYSNELHMIETLFLTEGEFKAFVGCMYDIPTIGSGGIHGFSKNTKDELL